MFLVLCFSLFFFFFFLGNKVPLTARIHIGKLDYKNFTSQTKLSNVYIYETLPVQHVQLHYWKLNIWCIFLFFLSSFLFKPADFFKGKTVFNHWLPGICYSNITFQLVSEATFNKSTLVEYSGVQHEPKQHRTGEENYYVPFALSLSGCFPFCCG